MSIRHLIWLSGLLLIGFSLASLLLAGLYVSVGANELAIDRVSEGMSGLIVGIVVVGILAATEKSEL